MFVLVMGGAVKIKDLAKNMIRLSGLKLGKDIEIVYKGLHLGEKLYEELLIEEKMCEMNNQMIYVGKPIELDKDMVIKTLSMMKAEDDEGKMRRMVKLLVSTYVLRGEWEKM